MNFSFLQKSDVPSKSYREIGKTRVLPQRLFLNNTKPSSITKVFLCATTSFATKAHNELGFCLLMCLWLENTNTCPSCPLVPKSSSYELWLWRKGLYTKILWFNRRGLNVQK